MLTSQMAHTGMSPLLTNMYLLLGAILSTGSMTFAARLPIMNDLFETNSLDQPIYNKYEHSLRNNDLVEYEGIEPRLQVELKPPRFQKLSTGDRLELVCEASGSPPPRILWYKENKMIQETGFEEQNDLASDALATLKSKLVIDCVNKHHHGSYSCKAVAGDLVEHSKPASIIVHGEENKACLERLSDAHEPQILAWSQLTIATIQGDISLPCNVVGNPQPEIFWKNQDNVNVAADPRFQILKSGELVISKIRWSDMGEYTCIAVSPMGRTQESTFLYPLSKEIQFGKSKRVSPKQTMQEIQAKQSSL